MGENLKGPANETIFPTGGKMEKFLGEVLTKVKACGETVDELAKYTSKQLKERFQKPNKLARMRIKELYSALKHISEQSKEEQRGKLLTDPLNGTWFHDERTDTCPRTGEALKSDDPEKFTDTGMGLDGRAELAM